MGFIVQIALCTLILIWLGEVHARQLNRNKHHGKKQRWRQYLQKIQKNQQPDVQEWNELKISENTMSSKQNEDGGYQVSLQVQQNSPVFVSGFGRVPKQFSSGQTGIVRLASIEALPAGQAKCQRNGPCTYFINTISCTDVALDNRGTQSTAPGVHCTQSIRDGVDQNQQIPQYVAHQIAEILSQPIGINIQASNRPSVSQYTSYEDTTSLQMFLPHYDDSDRSPSKVGQTQPKENTVQINKTSPFASVRTPVQTWLSRIPEDVRSSFRIDTTQSATTDNQTPTRVAHTVRTHTVSLHIIPLTILIFLSFVLCIYILACFCPSACHLGMSLHDPLSHSASLHRHLPANFLAAHFPYLTVFRYSAPSTCKQACPTPKRKDGAARDFRASLPHKPSPWIQPHTCAQHHPNQDTSCMISTSSRQLDLEARVAVGDVVTHRHKSNTTHLKRENSTGDVCAGGCAATGCVDSSGGQGEANGVGQTSKECSICLEEYRDGELVVTLPCQHQFHVNCMSNWLSIRAFDCPLCRCVVLPSVYHQDEA